MGQKWIGDRVRIKSLDTIGIYEGEITGEIARIKVNHIWKEIPFTDLEWLEDEEEEELDLSWIHASESEKKYQKVVNFNTKIDLHIEVLNQNMIGSPSGQIIDYQIAQCKSFIQKAIEFKIPKINIIHGKGKGVLAAEVNNLLKMFPEVNFYQASLSGGEVEVWLQYNR